MKKCILCGKTHDGACDRTGWDSIFSGKVNIPVNSANVTFGNPNTAGQAWKISGGVMEEISKTEIEALRETERQHIAKKRGRKPRNG